MEVWELFRKKLMLKLNDALAESQTTSIRMQSLEKNREELHDQIKQMEHELQRSNSTMSTMENLQKTQDRAMENLCSSFRETTTQLEVLREENSSLRMELRTIKKEVAASKGGL